MEVGKTKSFMIFHNKEIHYVIIKYFTSHISLSKSNLKKDTFSVCIALLWTFEEKQPNRRLLSFKVSGSPIATANYGHLMLWRRPSRNVTATVQGFETVKEIGRRLARFSSKVHLKKHAQNLFCRPTHEMVLSPVSPPRETEHPAFAAGRGNFGRNVFRLWLMYSN